jgi:hypothetical protein
LGEEREGERMTGGARGRDFWKKEREGGGWAEMGKGERERKRKGFSFSKI